MNTNSKSIKFATKRIMQHFAARFGPQVGVPKKPRLLILMYHRVLPDQDHRAEFEEPGMRVNPETFRDNLVTLLQHFEMVKLSEWLKRHSEGLTLPAKACAVTFDDGWADNHEFAFPILKELECPATVFLVASMIGTRKMFWPERLARITAAISVHHLNYWEEGKMLWLREGIPSNESPKAPLSSEELAKLISYTKRMSDQEIHRRLDILETELQLDVLSEKPSLLSWKQVTDMAMSGLIDIGSHTCNHVRLTGLIPNDILQQEVAFSKELIEKRTGRPVALFCYPNGDISDQALRLVRKNYISAVTTKSGWNNSQVDYYHLKRIGIHQDVANDKTAFLARISGWL